MSVSGVEINGNPYDYTNFGLLNYGASFGQQYAQAFSFESWNNNSTFDYGSELKLNGKGVDAVTIASGSKSFGLFTLQDKYDGTTESKLQADAVLIGKISGSSTVTGNFVVNTVDTLPEGIPGQIAFESGKMWVYLNGQWNEVQFVAPPEPSFIQFNVVGPETSSNDACNNSDEPIIYYSDSDLGSFGVGSTVYTNDELTVTADDGFYKLTNNGTWFEVSGSAGEIVDEASCG